MNFEADHFTSSLFALLEKKASEGIDVRVNIDGFSEMVTDGNLHVIPAFSKEGRKFRQLRIDLKELLLGMLKGSGVKVTITNQIRRKIEEFTPAHGRSHVKLSIVDSITYLGGLNLSDKDFARPDFMIRIMEPVITEQLAKIFLNPPKEDTSFPEVDGTQLLFDAGNKGSSIILTTAVSIIDSAQKELVLTSQFFPDGKVVKALQRAIERGVTVSVIISDPTQVFELPAHVFNRINQVKLLFSKKIPMYYYPSWIHAKLLIADSHDSELMVGLAGTHNLSETGVNWGNAEAALVSHNQTFITSARSIADRLLLAAYADSIPH